MRILPQVATGVHPKGSSGINPLTKGIIVQHHFLGSWKKKGGWRRFGVVEVAKRLLGLAPPEKPQAAATVKDSGVRHYPVSISHSQDSPAFSVLVDLVGHGDFQSREEVGAVLTQFGNWQAGSDPTMAPSAVSAVIGSLGDVSSHAVFVDIGAGIGFYSLYAASRGHRVIATELAPRSLAAFSASIDYNGFGNLITVRNVSVGTNRGPVCTQTPSDDATLGPWRPEEISRGYAHPALHARTGKACEGYAQRVNFEDVVQAEDNVRAVRISAGAWSSEVLHSALPFFRKRPPAVVLVEMDAAEMERAGSRPMVDILVEMRRIGYTDMSHAGWVCADRWEQITHDIRYRGKASPVQPLWCNLTAEHLAMVVQTNRKRGSTPVSLAAMSRPEDATGGVELIIMVYEGSNPSTNLAAAAIDVSSPANQDRSRKTRSSRRRDAINGSACGHGTSVPCDLDSHDTKKQS